MIKIHYNPLGLTYLLEGELDGKVTIIKLKPPSEDKGGYKATTVTMKSITVNMNIEEVSQCWYNWQQRGQFIQQAFAMLRAADREFLMTGLTESEWNETFKEEEN